MVLINILIYLCKINEEYTMHTNWTIITESNGIDANGSLCRVYAFSKSWFWNVNKNVVSLDNSLLEEKFKKKFELLSITKILIEGTHAK